jgi:hypothetical protein
MRRNAQTNNIQQRPHFCHDNKLLLPIRSYPEITRNEAPANKMHRPRFIAWFGLRRAEAIKFQPSYADHGDTLVLKPTWAKGGRGREGPIRNDLQRAVLDRAHKLAGKGSLIPANKSYVQQLGVYERATAKAGLHKMHGLRHAYAQARYQELTGWAAPTAGGPKAHELTPAQRDVDRKVRLQISEELGHGRSQVSALYLGR